MSEAHHSAKSDNPLDASASNTSLSDDGQQSLVKLGTKAYSERDYSTAVNFLEKAIAERPDHWKALACLGLSYFHLKRFSEAHETFTRIVADCPDEEVVVRAVQALDKVQTAMGQAGLEDLGGPSRTHADTGVHMGLNITPGAGQYDPQATGSFSSKDLPPDQREKYIKWGTNCYLDAKYEKAVEYLELGLAGEEENWNARLTLSMSYYKLGQFSIAEIVVNAIIAQCNDQKMLMRAKQALENIKVSNMQVDEGANNAFEEALAQKKEQKERAAAQRKADQAQAAATWQKLTPVSKRSEADGARKAHPAAIGVLAVLLLGVVYYCALQTVPRVYAGMFMMDDAKAASVSSLGTLGGISVHSFQMPGPNLTKLEGAYYGKPGAARLLIIHPATYNDIAVRKALAEAALNDGLSVLLYDTRGRGSSTGTASWDGIVDDGLFAYDYAHGKLGYKGPADIVSYGLSLGAATAAACAQQRPHAAAILENPFGSLLQVARDKMPLMSLVPDAFAPETTYAYLQNANTPHPPLLVVASKDPMIPAADTQAFLNKVSAPKENVTVSGPPTTDHWEQIVKFAEH